MANVALKGGGEVKLVRLEGHRAALDSASAAAPGTRLRYAIEGGRALCIKVHRCVRTGDRFAIEGRPIDLTRELRQLLQRKLSGEAMAFEIGRGAT